MLDLLTQLYDIDALRFPLWDLLDTLNLDSIAAKCITFTGHVLYEDFSIGGK
jgi:hypothetical protein